MEAAVGRSAGRSVTLAAAAEPQVTTPEARVFRVLAAVRFDTFFGDGQAKGGLAICH
jgi:hypothetical protein